MSLPQLDEDEERDKVDIVEVDGPRSMQAADSAQRQRRRGRAAYASGSGRDLSTSARKRESVLALGSIKHLQHHFAKSGLAASTAPQIGSSGRPLPLAVPGYAPDAFDESLEDLPPSPSPPAPLPRDVFPSQSQLPSLRVRREQVYRQVSEVCERWGIVEMGKHRRESTSATPDRAIATPSPSFSEDRERDNLVLNLLQTTTGAIRAVQKYFVSLPPDKLPYSSGSADRAQRREGSTSSSARPATLGVITSARPIPRYSTLTPAPRRSLSPPRSGPTSDEEDPLLRLRKASLATLGALKDMDTRYRLPGTAMSEDELSSAFDSMDVSSSSSSSVAIERSESGSSSAGTGTTTGHLYSDDVVLADLTAEAEKVRKWIEVVDSLLFAKTAESALKTPRPRTNSTAMSDAQGRDSVPKWAREDAFSADGMEQVHACLRAHLPDDLLAALPDYPTSDARVPLLVALSDGQLLCEAYNAVLRRSQRPWGFIPASSIHDVLSLAAAVPPSESARPSLDSDRLQVASSGSMRRASSDGGSGLSDDARAQQPKVGMTFRRAENLRIFIAALKLRHLVQLTGESVDPKVIARKEQGWMDMLEKIAVSWVTEAANEKREEEPDSD